MDDIRRVKSASRGDVIVYLRPGIIANQWIFTNFAPEK